MCPQSRRKHEKTAQLTRATLSRGSQQAAGLRTIPAPSCEARLVVHEDVVTHPFILHRHACAVQQGDVRNGLFWNLCWKETPHKKERFLRHRMSSTLQLNADETYRQMSESCQLQSDLHSNAADHIPTHVQLLISHELTATLGLWVGGCPILKV
jgi:hypothetical protein